MRFYYTPENPSRLRRFLARIFGKHFIGYHGSQIVVGYTLGGALYVTERLETEEPIFNGGTTK